MILDGDNIVGKHPARGGGERNGFGWQWMSLGEDSCQRFVRVAEAV
jgi:hypothetical protein